MWLMIKLGFIVHLISVIIRHFVTKEAFSCKASIFLHLCTLQASFGNIFLLLHKTLGIYEFCQEEENMISLYFVHNNLSNKTISCSNQCKYQTLNVPLQVQLQGNYDSVTFLCDINTFQDSGRGFPRLSRFIQ